MDPIVELLQALASPKLWRQVLAQGWHPCMRYPKNVTFCAEGGRRLPARAFVFRPDTAWVGSGTAFGAAAAKRRCTLPAVWYAQQEEPWTILTGLPPDEVGVSWYALRFWVELGFRACPRPRPGGGQEPGLAMAKDPRAGTAARPGLSTPPAPGAGPLQVWKRQGVQPVTQRPPPHGTGLAACPVDPLTQRLEGPGTGRSGAGWMPGRTHFRPGHGPGAAVRGSQGPAAAFFSVCPTFQGMKCPKRAEKRSPERKQAAPRPTRGFSRRRALLARARRGEGRSPAARRDGRGNPTRPRGSGGGGVNPYATYPGRHCPQTLQDRG